MEFKFYFICKTYFDNVQNCFAHFKNVHFLRDNAQNIQCIVNSTEGEVCDKSYNTFGGLRNHVKKCLEKKKKVIRMLFIMMKRGLFILTKFIYIFSHLKNRSYPSIKKLYDKQL